MKRRLFLITPLFLLAFFLNTGVQAQQTRAQKKVSAMLVGEWRLDDFKFGGIEAMLAELSESQRAEIKKELKKQVELMKEAGDLKFFADGKITMTMLILSEETAETQTGTYAVAADGASIIINTDDYDQADVMYIKSLTDDKAVFVPAVDDPEAPEMELIMTWVKVRK